MFLRVTFIQICMLIGFVISGSAQTIENNTHISFTQEPVTGNTFLTYNSFINNYHSLDVMQKNLEEDRKTGKFNIDSAVWFITNFTFQKTLTFFYADTFKLQSQYGDVFFKVLSTSFLTELKEKAACTYHLSVTDHVVYGMGKCRVFEITRTYKNGSHGVANPRMLCLIFPKKENRSQLPVFCIALFADNIHFSDNKGSKTDIPVLGFRHLDGRGDLRGYLYMPIIYETNNHRFVPVDHYLSKTPLLAN
ncbi:MAG TPA: hypothetical protein VG842_05385 [Sediminibacterium sp.]|nr:hypothetical protein [Sediminibacterium sp.]